MEFGPILSILFLPLEIFWQEQGVLHGSQVFALDEYAKIPSISSKLSVSMRKLEAKLPGSSNSGTIYLDHNSLVLFVI